MKKHSQRLILIDSNALLHRAYHALPPLTKKDGTLTNAVYGYAITIFSVLEKFKPDYIVATFDLAGPTFRHEQFSDYKATRKKAPDEFYAQIPMAKEFLRAYNIPIYEKQGYEADDVIGTIAKTPKINGDVEKIIVTGDLDTLQLVDEHTKVFTLRRGITDTVTYDSEKVKERYGLEPWQMIEYKALRGDQSDNIPGVKGIGEKTAIELLLKYQDIDNVYKNVEQIASKSVAAKLKAGKESAYMSKQLATIDTKVPIDFELEACNVHEYDRQKLLDFLKEMEFYSLVKRLSPKDVVESSPNKPGKNSSKKTQKAALEAPVQIKILENEKEIEALAEQIRKNKIFAFEFCTSQDKYYQALVFGLGITSQEETVFVPIEKLKPIVVLFAEENILKVGYNVKFGWEILSKIDVNFKIKNFFDVQIAAYLLMSGTANELEKLIFEEFTKEMEYKLVKKGQTSLLDSETLTRQKNSAEKTYWIAKLYQVYKEKLLDITKNQRESSQGIEHTLDWVYEEVEKPLVEILANMEMAGVKIQKEKLLEGSQLAEVEIKKLEEKIYAEAGSTFNINSPIQLAKVLYEDLAIPTFDIKRGKTGYSTDAEQLKKIHEHHPIIASIEYYRELFKVKSTYSDTLPLLVEDDGRIHANFNQAVTATGRLSSSDPNLQNIPKKGRLAKLIREAFIAEKEYSLVAADYSQIDLRVAAHLSEDPRLMAAFKEGKDIHRATAAWVNGILESAVTDQQRREAKSLNFGVLYGMSTYGFMRDSGVSRERADLFIREYMKSFAGLKIFLDKIKEFAKQHGYVETQIGRRRYIPNMKAANHQVRAAAERMAINLPVQGLSADIMKLAMIEVQNKLLSNYGQKARLILQIHDELIFEVKDDLIDEFIPKVKSLMQGVYKLKVPLIVEVESGKNWSEV